VDSSPKVVFAALALWAGCATSRAAPARAEDAGAAAEAGPDSTGLAATALNLALPIDQRVEALRGLAKNTGVSAVSVAASCLEDDSSELRLAAANVLGALAGKDARAALTARLGVEEEPAVRDALQRGLAKCEP
jgi:HEAT repeat protein